MKKTVLYIIVFFCVFVAQAQKPSPKTDSVKQELKTLEVEKLLIQANLSKNKGDFHRAMELYSGALSIDKTSAVAYYEMAGLFLFRNMYADAENYAKKAVQYNPSRVAYVERLAQVYMLQGNQKKLQETLRQLKKLEPARGKTVHNTIAVQPQPEEKTTPPQTDVEIIKTTNYKQLLQNPTNEKIYEIVTKQYSEKDPVAWDSIALVNEMALNYFPGTAEYYLQAARAHYEMGQYEKAIQLLNAALENSFADDRQKREIESLLIKARGLNPLSE